MTSFLFLVVVAVVVVVVVAMRGRTSPAQASAESVGSTIRRLFQYALLLAVVILVAAGLSAVLGGALSRDVVAGDRTSLALPLSYLAVGLPSLLGLGWWIRSQHARRPIETSSLAWTVYLSAASIVALSVAVVSWLGTFEWLLGAESYSGDDLARSVVWTGVFAAHWVLARRSPRQDRLVVHRLIGSAIGLSIGATGLGNTIAAGLRQLYDLLGDQLVAADYNWTWRNAFAYLIVGGAVWAWYWFRHVLVADDETGLFSAYVLVVGVLAGAVAALIGLAGIINDGLVWWFGDAEPTAMQQFASMPGSIAAVATGLWVWWYHRTVLAPQRTVGRAEVHRSYDYLVSAIGLVATGTGSTVLFMALFDTLSSQQPLASDVSGINLVIGAVTALLVGVPVWMSAWAPSERLSRIHSNEANAPSRRAYLFLIFGIGGTIALISLILVFFAVFQWMLGESTNVLRDTRTPLSLVLTVGSLAVYHWMVYRGDRAAFPPEAVGVRSIVLVGATPAVGQAVAKATGAKVQTMQRADDESSLEAEQISDALVGHVGENVMVISNGGRAEVIPLRG